MSHHYSPEELAHKWRVSQDTIYRMMNRQELQSFRVGRRRIVLSSSVEAYEQRGLAETGLAEVIPLRRVQ